MYSIKTAAVIGSGVMGAQIAAHLASCGIKVWLLDLKKDQGPQLASQALGNLKKIKPLPFYTSECLALITPGTLEENLEEAAQSDWLIEAIVEQVEPKIQLLKKIEKWAGSKTLVSTNTSGIPLQILAAQLNPSLQARFLGTHFFNPPRYLRLVEVIKGPQTSTETYKCLVACLENQLGKTVVEAHDIPCFIANRLGVFCLVHTLQLTLKYGHTLEEMDVLTGSLMGRPKTGTFKLADLVGIDTLLHILDNLVSTLPAQESEAFKRPDVLTQMVNQGLLGKKSKKGFYKKEGEQTWTLDLCSLNYRPFCKANIENLSALFKITDSRNRLKALPELTGQVGCSIQELLAGQLHYAFSLSPKLSKDILAVDEAMKLGFGWEWGPFEIADILGKTTLQQLLEKFDLGLPDWMQNAEFPLIQTQPNHYLPLSYTGTRLSLKPRGFNLFLHKKHHTAIWKNTSASLWDTGEDVALLEFHSKMNTQDLASLQAIQDAIQTSAQNFLGLVIANQAQHFCAGANLGMILIDAANGEYENIRHALKMFQKATLAIKYSPIPVVVSTQGLTLGGGCEIAMHSPRLLASPETYAGLVEAGVGLLPAGGGLKELALRVYRDIHPSYLLARLIEIFKLCATAQVAGSAHEAIKWGLFPEGTRIASNEATRLSQALAEVKALATGGYRPTSQTAPVPVLGKTGLAALEIGIQHMHEGGYASSHDVCIAQAIARVLTGGEVSEGTLVTEKQFLEKEQEEFLTLAGMPKTLARIEYMLKKGKPLRN